MRMVEKQFEDSDFGLICICAMRYALSRKSYVPRVVRQYITKNNQLISNNDLKVMFDDITTSRIAEIDSLEQQEWLNFAGELQNMLLERSK